MKNLVLTLAAFAAFGVAQATAATVVDDVDGNGTYSMEEMVAAYPDLTDEEFAAIDVNGDAEVDADEMAAAIGAGLIAE